MHGYFHRVMAQTPTKFWINNPTRQEAERAIEAGALGCTLNPSYSQKMLDHPSEGTYALAALDEAIRESKDDKEAAVVLQRKLARPIVEKFFRLYEKFPGRDGYVSIQGDPLEDEDPHAILHQASTDRALAPNVCIKVPCTAAGLKAMETLIAQEVAINGTEIFAYAQAETFSDLNERGRRESGKQPRVYLSHIAGIYDDYLKQHVERNRVQISPDVLWQAGLAVARKVYRLLTDRKYSLTFVGGGARGLHHFTEMVGADAVVTINWKGTAEELLKLDPPVVYRVFNPVPQHVIDELMLKLPDFKRGYIEDGLRIEEYAEFGPVQLFRDSFVRSWTRVLDVAKERRAALQP